MSSCGQSASTFFTGPGLRLPWLSDASRPHEAPGVLGPGGFGLPVPGLSARQDEPMTPATENETSPTPDIAALREEIGWLDSEILRLVKRRVEVSQTIGAARMAAGGPRIV